VPEYTIFFNPACICPVTCPSLISSFFSFLPPCCHRCHQLGPVGVRDVALALAMQAQQACVSTPVIDPANPPLHMHAGLTSTTKGSGGSSINSGLVSLTLRHNGAASSGVQALCRALLPPPLTAEAEGENGSSSTNAPTTTKEKRKKVFNNCTLTRLDLASNNITDAGAVELAQLFLPTRRTSTPAGGGGGDNANADSARSLAPGNFTLTYLDVSDNAVGVRGATKLLEAAQKCSTLLSVQVWVA